ncbi:hypothetical protein TCAL_16084, partial [Tigriopus californicus]
MEGLNPNSKKVNDVMRGRGKLQELHLMSGKVNLQILSLCVLVTSEPAIQDSGLAHTTKKKPKFKTSSVPLASKMQQIDLNIRIYVIFG